MNKVDSSTHSSETVPHDLCYSLDEEFFYPELDDVLSILEGDGYLEVGVTIYEGTPVRRNASYYTPTMEWFMDQMAEQAGDEAGEHAGDWPLNTSNQKVAEFEKKLHALVDEYFPPTFYTVENVRAITVTADMLPEPPASSAADNGSPTPNHASGPQGTAIASATKGATNE